MSSQGSEWLLIPCVELCNLLCDTPYPPAGLPVSVRVGDRHHIKQPRVGGLTSFYSVVAM